MSHIQRQSKKHSNTVIRKPKSVPLACYRALGARIEQVRQMMGLTQGELAQKVKLSRTAVTNIEAGRQGMLLHQVENFAQGLGVPVKTLLKGIWF